MYGQDDTREQSSLAIQRQQQGPLAKARQQEARLADARQQESYPLESRPLTDAQQMLVAREAKYGWLYRMYGARPYWYRHVLNVNSRYWTPAEKRADEIRIKLQSAEGTVIGEQPVLALAVLVAVVAIFGGVLATKRISGSR